MANINKTHSFIAEFCLGCDTIPLFSGRLRSAQTIADGDALMVSNGLISIAVTGTRKVVGVSAQAVTATATKQQDILFVPALESVVFSGQYGSSGSNVFTQGLVWSRRNFSGTTGAQKLTTGVLHSTAICWIVGLRRSSTFASFGEAMFIWSRSAFSNRNNHTIGGAV